ncbi:putative inorganic phosphate cotransporter isoform X1 [Myzus persicae]|uniref:putative inorganic phosphate cotransporter isoform X1 n=1 Tax=Myzus persicae TaxID=13164 RepID=UPI000B938843|nr:putative inorganic phosphate cotransporter isoform X1 [Myzus persicae]
MALKKNSDGRGFIQQRYVLSSMGFMALAIGYVQRFCLSLAITEMAEQSHHTVHQNANLGTVCPSSRSFGNTTHFKKEMEFDWDEKTQGLVLSSFFWGYVVTQMPGGMLADTYGGKATLGLGMLFSSIGTIITPVVARSYGPEALIVLRLIIGLAQGPLYPAMSRLLASWVPVEERGRLGSLVFAGAQVGNVASMQLGGFLMRYTNSWTSVFYAFGVFGIFWLMFWFVLIYNHPNRHPFISQKEKQYLNRVINTVDPEDGKLSIPWKSIATSGPVWGLIIVQIGHDWGLFTIITDLPKYMKSVLKFSVVENGLLSGLPYIVMWLVAMGSGFIVDSMLSSQYFTVTCIRKTFVTIASVGPALGIVAASYSGCDKVLAVASFTIGMGLMGTFVPSLKVNALDLSPNFAGTLMAIVGTIGCLSGVIAPYIVGIMVPNSSMEEWRDVFWLSAAILIATNLLFLQYGSGNVQPWNEKANRQYKSSDINNENNTTSILKPL